MKIRKFTEDETADLIVLINERDKLAIEINKLGITYLFEQYDNYCKNFKYSILNPFTFSPPNVNTFVTGVLGGGGTYTYRSGRLVSANDDKEFSYLYGWQSDAKYEFKDKKAWRYFWQIDAVSTIVFRNLKDDDEFIDLVLNYAERPFEFNETDIQKIQRWKKEIEVIREIKEFFTNELQID